MLTPFADILLASCNWGDDFSSFEVSPYLGGSGRSRLPLSVESLEASG